MAEDSRPSRVLYGSRKVQVQSEDRIYGEVSPCFQKSLINLPNGHDEDLVIFDWDSLKENISKAKQSTAVTGGALREYNNWFGRLSPDIFQTVW